MADVYVGLSHACDATAGSGVPVAGAPSAQVPVWVSWGRSSFAHLRGAAAGGVTRGAARARADQRADEGALVQASSPG